MKYFLIHAGTFLSACVALYLMFEKNSESPLAIVFFALIFLLGCFSIKALN